MKPLLCCLWAAILCTGVAVAQDKLLEPYTGTAAVSPFQQDQPQEGLPVDDQFDAATRAPCAGDVDIDGAGTTNWGYTLNVYYKSRRSTSIYLASQFNCSEGGPITGIRYYVTQVPALPMTNLTIRLRQTTATVYTSPYCFNNDGWLICYQATTTISTTGWYTFEFITPFPYDGVSNLEVDVSFGQNATYNNSGQVWSFSSGTGIYRTLYAYSDTYTNPQGWTCGTGNPTVYSSASVPRAKFIFPGGGPVGACCKPDGSCLPGLTEPECAAQGGIWMGEGTTCTPNNCPQPPVRCCMPDGTCQMIPAVDCTLMGGVPGAYGTNCDPIDSYVTLPCGSPFEDISGTGTHVAAAEVDDGGAAVPLGFTFTFYGVPKTSIGVTSNGYLTFGTTYGDYSPDPIPSTNVPNDLIAVLWRDLNATGHSVQYQTFGAEPFRWFIAQWTDVPCYSGCGPNTFQAVLYESDGCIELRYLLLDPAVSGYKAGVENATGTIGVDVTGMVATGACIRLCPGVVPPCPQPGACCFLDGSCVVVSQAACNSLYGVFHGEGTTCDPNPCPPPCVECPPGGMLENEPDCGPEYVDNYNGGCNSTPNVFQPIACGLPICGEAGTYLVGGQQRRDTDWYEIVTSQPTVFTWTVVATFPALVGMIEQITPGVPGCANITGYVVPSFTTVACQPGGVTTVCLPAGTYYFFVATSAFAGVPCGSPYVAMLTCEPCPVGACCLSDGQCLPDLNQPDCTAMGGAWQGAGTLCDPSPCIGACCYLDGFCEVVSPAQCSAAGGTYLGGGTNCDSSPCPHPGPDTCDQALLLPVPGAIYGHNRLATDDNPPYCGTSAPYKGVWYKIVGTGNTITVSTCSLKTLFDTKIQVFCDCPAVTCVTGNDDSCSISGHSLNSTVTFCSALGQTHYITVGSYSSTTVGDFELIVTDDGIPCSGALCVPIGACCFPDGSCTMTPEEQCSGIWLGEGSSCINCEPCTFCGPGPHFIDTCPASADFLPSGALVGIDTSLDCVADTNLIMNGPVAVHRTAPLDDSVSYPGTRPVDGHLDVIDTEIVAMSLTGGGVVLTAGAGHGQGGVLAASLGNMAELPANPAVAESFFDVFFEVDLGSGNYVYNQTALRVQTPVTCITPFQDYIHIQDCVELWTSPTPGQGTHVANLVAPIHDAYPFGACCFPDGSCQTTTTEQVCQQAGGVYQGVGTTCHPNTCPQPPAACCYPDGTCAVTLPADCTGVFHPEWPNCDVAQCPQPPETGACCIGTVCYSDVTEAHCIAQGGQWKGANSVCFPSPCLPPPDYYFDPTGGQGGNGYQDQWYYYGNYNWWNMWWDNEFSLERHKLIHVSLDVWFPQQGAVTIALNWDTPAWTQLQMGRPPLPADVPDPATEDLYIGRQILETISWTQVPPYPQSGHFDFAFELPFCPDWVSMDVQGNGYQVQGTITHVCLPAANGACCWPGSVCQVTTAEQCAAAGGTFKGAGTVCDPNPCVCPGDLNCDGVVDFGDINPFVLILSNFGVWQQTYPGCPWQNGDIDGNGSAGFEDINPFVALIVQSPFVCQY